jgi:ADP-ribose pyrophosphatase
MSTHAKPWKIIKTKVLFEHPSIVITEDVVELPNGRQTNYVSTPSSTDCIIVIAINASGKVLVQREYSHPPRKIMWQLPGGSMLPDESVDSAVKRELAEESGYSAKSVEVIGSFYTANRKTNKRQYVALCSQIYEKKLPADSDEFIDSYWITVEKLKSMITENEIENINLLAAINLWFIKKDI